jgi:transcriptional regulator with XRE-family HTH domain
MNPQPEYFSEKLNRLVEEKRKPDGKPYSQTEIIEGTKSVLTRVYLWKLRTGRASNPGYHIIQAIADFFGVDPSYFFEGEEKKLEEMEFTAAENDLVSKISLRSTMLDDEGKKIILGMIDYILKSQRGGEDETKEA